MTTPTPFAFAKVHVPAGTTLRIDLPFARSLTGAALGLPVIVAHGKHPGPALWVSAALHGDELNGVAIIRRLLRTVDPNKLHGTLVALPAVNVLGLELGQRYLPDRRDLNRCFPGTARGSLGSQLAHLFMEEVVAHCDWGIDLHTGSDGRSNWPQIRCNVDDPKILRVARAFGAPLVLHSSMRDGSLRAAAARVGVPVLLYEAGEANRFSDKAIKTGVVGVKRVMSALGMFGSRGQASPRTEHGSTIIARTSSWVRASRSGFCELSTRLGARIAEGDTLAHLYGWESDRGFVVRSHQTGVVIGLATAATVHRGDAIAHIARLDGHQSARSVDA